MCDRTIAAAAQFFKAELGFSAWPIVSTMSFLDSRTRAARDGVGKAVRRLEDRRLVTGAGSYSDDVNLPGQAYAAFVRSPYAHARIVSIDVGAAQYLPGVLAVLTGEDAARDGLQPIPNNPVPSNPHEVPLKGPDGASLFVAPHRALPHDRARFVGEAVAMVVAASPALARDAADRVVVHWTPLAAAVTAADATVPGAPLVWTEAGANVCVKSEAGDATATAAAFASAAHVVRLETRVNRVTGVPMEPRAVVAAWRSARGATPSTPTRAARGGSGPTRRPRWACRRARCASWRAKSAAATARATTCPEIPLVAWAAQRLGKPVKWRAERQECFLSDDHARALSVQAELALDKDGNFLAFRSANTSDVGAYPFSYIPLTKGVGVATRSTTCPALPSGRARSARTRWRPRPTAPPAAPR